MSEYLNLDTVDPTGAIRNAADEAGALDRSFDRRSALRRGAAAGGGIVIAGGLFQTMLSPAEAAISRSKKSKTNDVKILQYALTLEYLESAFYAQGNANIKFADPILARFAQITGKHEADHVAALIKTLGKKKTIPVPEVAFGAAVTDEKTFAATAQVLEDTGVAAYAGQVGNVLQGAVLAAAASIHSVEARHAAWIRFINGGGAVGAAESAAPAPVAFDAALTEKKVLAAVRATKFVPGL